jgi:hypothetical protein
MIHENRLGRFKVSRDFLKRWKDCLWMFGNFVIVDVTNRSWDEHIVEYLAFSELFEISDRNVIAPLYEICVETSDGFPKIKAVKLQ